MTECHGIDRLRSHEACSPIAPSFHHPCVRLAWSAHATEPDTTGIYAEFLDGHFAASIGDLDQSASDFLEAVTVDPSERALVRHAFEESLLAGRPEAMRLAARLPGDDTAEIALGVSAAQAGDWADAERRFGTLSKQGITGLI